MINSGHSHRSVPAQELYSMAAPSVGGSVTTQSVQPQGEIPEEGKKKIKLVTIELTFIWSEQNGTFSKN